MRIFNNVKYSSKLSRIKALIDAAVDFEHELLIRCDIKPRSSERSIDHWPSLYKVLADLPLATLTDHCPLGALRGRYRGLFLEVSFSNLSILKHGAQYFEYESFISK